MEHTSERAIPPLAESDKLIQNEAYSLMMEINS
jgi:hypothetical protein